uniref:Uncharacterized protein n=1 Tax=Oryza meridionalis TaxID=40149 RepID=A0A0E0D7J0_9ORYZ
MSKLARTSSPIRSGPHSLHPTVIAAARLFSPLPSSRFAGAGGGGGELGRSLHGNSRESGYRYRNRSTSFCKIAGDRICNKPTVRDNGTDAEQLIGLQART